MKIEIGICDDEKTVCDYLAHMLREIGREMNLPLALHTVLTGKDALKLADRLDILFLDIDMPEMDGIEVGRELKAKKYDCKTVMATGREDRYKEAFMIAAYRFVTKPFQKEEVRDVLESYWLDLEENELLKVYQNRIPHLIRKKDIHYITARESYVEIWIGNEMYRWEGSLKKIQTELDEIAFQKIDQGFIVNFKWVSDVKEGAVCVNGKWHPCSRRQRSATEQSYRKYKSQIIL